MGHRRAREVPSPDPQLPEGLTLRTNSLRYIGPSFAGERVPLAGLLHGAQGTPLDRHPGGQQVRPAQLVQRQADLGDGRPTASALVQDLGQDRRWHHRTVHAGHRPHQRLSQEGQHEADRGEAGGGADGDCQRGHHQGRAQHQAGPSQRAGAGGSAADQVALLLTLLLLYVIY